MCFLLDYSDSMILLLLIDAYKLNEVSQYHKIPSGVKCTPYFYRNVSIAPPKASQNFNRKFRNAHPKNFDNLNSQVWIPRQKDSDKHSKFKTKLKPFQEISQ